MTIVTMPEGLYSLSALRFNLVTANTVRSGGAFNPFAQVDGPSAWFWQVEMTITPKKDDDLDEVEQFIASLRGGKVLARIYDQRRVAGGSRTQPGGTTIGPVANVAADVAVGAESVQFKNLAVSAAIGLKAMDQFQVGENLYRIQNSGPSDGAGEGTFSFLPPARNGWAVDDAVTLVKPTGLFRLTGGANDFGVNEARIMQPLSLSFTEEPDFA